VSRLQVVSDSLTFQALFQRGPCAYSEKVLVRDMSLKTREGGHNSENRAVGACFHE